MGYLPPILTTEAIEVFTHNNDAISPGNAFILGYAPDADLTTYQFLGKARNDDLRDFICHMADPMETGEEVEPFVILHAVDPSSDIVDANLKLSKMHAHVITADWSEKFAHILTEKSYVHTPNPTLERDITAQLTRDNKISVMKFDLIDEEKEAQRHIVGAMPKFISLKDLGINGTNDDIEEFRGLLKSIATPFLVGDRKGGCRIIIDERYMNTGCLTVQAIGGANLDRTSQGLRYFQNPNSAPT